MSNCIQFTIGDKTYQFRDVDLKRSASLNDIISAIAEDSTYAGLLEDLNQQLNNRFLSDYYAKKIYESDPFARLDQTGVGKLVKMAADLGRQTRPDIKLGICGEHGGDPSSVRFCHKVGLTYVSCSPFRVPIARLAAAQAAIEEG